MSGGYAEYAVANQTEVGLLEQSARRLNRFYVEKFAVGAEKSAGIIVPVMVGAN